MLDLAGPREPIAGHEILDIDGSRIGEPELPKGHLKVASLGVVRVEIDRDQHEVLLVRGKLAVIENLVVPGVVEIQVLELLQRRVLAPQPVDETDILANVPRTVPVPRLDLVLLRVEILLLAGDRTALTKLKATVDSIVAGERGRQDQPDPETRPSA